MLNAATLTPYQVWILTFVSFVCCINWICLSTEVTCSRCSPDGKVMKTMVASHSPSYDLETGIERYLFTVQSICSSSRLVLLHAFV